MKPDRHWPPAGRYREIETIDAHTEGEPFRVIVGGPELRGDTILQFRRDAKSRFDALRTALMWEPRGHADMYGCFLTPPVSPTADFGILFIHNEGFSTMCGHGIIAITTVVLETGMMAIEGGEKEGAETRVRIDSPAGLVTAYGRVQDGRVRSVRFHNVPSFVVALDEAVQVPGLGEVRYDLAYGGAFYAYVDAESVGLTCSPEDFHGLIDKGKAIKHAVMASREIEHPFEQDLGFLYGVIFTGPAVNAEHHSRNVCIFADGEVDRCPTGTGVSARVAIHHAKGEIARDEPIVIESIVGSHFTGRVVETTEFGPYAAVIPEVEGRAFITGRHRFLIDANDDLRDGFLLR